GIRAGVFADRHRSTAGGPAAARRLPLLAVGGDAGRPRPGDVGSRRGDDRRRQYRRLHAGDDDRHRARNRERRSGPLGGGGISVDDGHPRPQCRGLPSARLGEPEVWLMFPLRISGLRFAPSGRTVLDGVDLDLSGEGISVILGPNGAGKTLLLRLLAGLLPADGGAISWAGAAEPDGRLAMVFQQPMLLRMSVFTNVEFALRPQAMSAAERRARSAEVLDRVGLAHRARDCARLLSGGERQRLALARAWAMRPRLLLLDEPTASLDPSATEAVERIIREIRTEGAKVLKI